MRAWPAERGDLRSACVRFGRLLREHGLPVTADRVIRWLGGLELLGCSHPADLYWSGRVTLVSDRGGLERYDDLFRRYWLTLEHAALDPLQGQDGRTLPGAPRREAPLSEEPGAGRDGGSTAQAEAQSRGWRIGQEYRPPGTGPAGVAAQDGPGEPETNGPELVPGEYSSLELLRQKDFSAFNREDEKRLVQLLQAHPDWLAPRMRSRRTRQAAAGDRLDLRRMVRAAVRWGGDPVSLHYRTPVRRRRKWVILCDVSASMAPYTRAFLVFAAAVAAGRRSTEVFLFGTRLTRVTAQLLRRGAGSAEALLPAVRDYHGGTRLGEALEQFLRQYGRRGMAHGADLFILSDGIDHGEAGRVAAAMAQLDRLAHSVSWVNPLRATRGYAPETQAMQEALPHVDCFVSGHNVKSLTDLLERVAGVG